MWAWYREWATLARTAVKNRNYLVVLGLTAHRGGSAGSGGGEDDDGGASSAETPATTVFNVPR